MEVLFEFKVQRAKKTVIAEEQIRQIFQNLYYSDFKTEKKDQEKIIIGIVMDARDSQVIKEYKVLKYKGVGVIGDPFNWMQI